jgi:hypothetical protein
LLLARRQQRLARHVQPLANHRSSRCSESQPASVGEPDELCLGAVGPDGSWIAHMGVWPVKSCVCDGGTSFGVWRSIRGSSPFADLALRRINLTFGRRAVGDCTLIPLSAARAREAGPFFASAFLTPSNPSAADPDRPRLISPRQMRGVRNFGLWRVKRRMSWPPPRSRRRRW